MDTFGEQLVKKKTTTSDYMKKGALILGGILVATVLLTFSFATGFMVLTMLAVGVLFGTVWLLSGMSYEYEYILTNDDLDIDKISGKRSRKRLITVKLSTVEDFGIYDGTQGENAQATVIASDGTDVNNYYLLAKHKTHGLTLVIFSPDERMIKILVDSLTHKVRLNVKLKLMLRPSDIKEETE